MATQGATLRRGTAHAPIWPVAALITAALAAVIGIRMIDTQDPAAGSVRQVTQYPTGLENPGVGAVADTRAWVPSMAALEVSSAAVREQGAVLPVPFGISHVTPKVRFAGLENPGAYVTIQGTSFATGLENPGAYPASHLGSDGVFTPTMGPRPGYGANCGQCR